MTNNILNNNEKKIITLTSKQKMFVKEYLIDLNATQAAIRAGYSENCAAEQGSENLRKPYIQEAITKAMKELIPIDNLTERIEPEILRKTYEKIEKFMKTLGSEILTIKCSNCESIFRKSDSIIYCQKCGEKLINPPK